ncbi:efflux RND transporter permease subunit [Desulfosarcina sp.]|uniref:efflux RND transporter permease subunit n=1 Tax=Desulfosarcina sp. TaxID=2027861 RepID=UPI0029A910B3|nr:efflux RND transporter permease subunit [Desulfosarcina sp.]MDX2451017.1 efflux RND transporter permease subunit [Desulfosarcina sp.]MDX2488844.1 efflux RND transporter permease subunit [Desulfosarcina sp.]
MIADAARHASREGSWAVLITSLSTIAWLLPLLSEKSLQAPILIPLATSVVSGMIASTIFLLLVVPFLYTILGDFGLTSVQALDQDTSAHTSRPILTSKPKADVKVS